MPDTDVQVSERLNIILGCTATNSKGNISIDDPLSSADAETVMVAGEAVVAKGVLVDSKGEVYDSVLSAEKVSITKQKLF